MTFRAIIPVLAAMALSQAAPVQAQAQANADFDGRWRVVAGDPAPWVKPAPRAAALGMSVVIGPGGVEGPPGFGCPRTPTIAEQRTTLREMSRGVRVDTIRMIAAREGVRSDRVAVRQVICGSAAIEFVRLENGTIVAFVDDIYYTLRKAADDGRRT
jgi:hypothetical protein